jgi:DNA helicase-2/ATP-dependent DNA helicase PcrA
VAGIADGLGVPMLEVIRDAGDYPALGRAAKALGEFYGIYEQLLEARRGQGLAEFADSLLSITGYRQMLAAQKEDGAARLENVEELISNIKAFEADSTDGDLALFLEEIALVSSVDSYDSETDAVVLMTLHSAKGLEFDCVFIVGMEEGIFPGEQSRYSQEDVEEERRLAYVGYTRAKRQLHLTRASARLLFGQTRRNAPSRFLEEFDDAIKDEAMPERRPSAGSGIQGEYRRANELALRGLERRAENPGAERGVKSRITVGAPGRRDSGGRQTAFMPGDLVEHRIFGRGMVLDARPLGGDMLVEIDFETAGVKKAMANYAPMKKITSD